jgi:hypothetical protein
MLAAACSMLVGAEKPPQNLFANPGFESGREEWRLDKAGKTDARFAVDTSDAAAGQASAVLTIGAVEEWGVQFGQSFDAPAKGKTFTFAAMAKAAKSPVTVRLEIERSANPYDRAARSENAALAPGKWTESHVTFKVDKDFREGWFAYVSCAQANAEFRVDAVRLYEGEYVPLQQAAKQQDARDEAAGIGVSVFDTLAPSSAPLSGEAVAARKGWTKVPPGRADYAFKGDAVLANDRVAVIFRRGAAGAEVYGLSPRGAALRATLAPAAGAAGAAAGTSAGAHLDSFKVAKNAPGAAAVDAAMKAADGKPLGLACELAMGQVFVKTEPRGGAKALRVDAPCRFIVLPDFFADDIVIDAAEIPVAAAELPSENFILRLMGAGEAVLMTVSADRDEEVCAAFSGQGAQRVISRTGIPYGKSGKTWVAVLEDAGVWHRRDVAKEETGNITPLNWKMPWPAQWRLDWRKADRLTDSWEMLLPRPGGEFLKPALFDGDGAIPANRKRWTTVLGSFAYPCWIDKDGQGYIQPLKSNVVRFEGPALLYPLARVKGTPLEVFTVADIARSTLGVGPCEYILDVEGQGSQSKGRATCATRDALRPIYQARQQKARRAEIEKILGEVMVFVRYIRGRIETYVDFGHKTLAYLQEQKRTHPELAGFAAEMEPLCKAIDGYVEKRKDEIRNVDSTQAMVDDFRKTLFDYDGADAFEKCKKFTEDLVRIGGNQDELVGECRMAVKIVRQRAGLAMALDPRVAPAATEIRRRSQEVLRNPAGHESARH